MSDVMQICVVPDVEQISEKFCLQVKLLFPDIEALTPSRGQCCVGQRDARNLESSPPELTGLQ